MISPRSRTAEVERRARMAHSKPTNSAEAHRESSRQIQRQLHLDHTPSVGRSAAGPCTSRAETVHPAAAVSWDEANAVVAAEVLDRVRQREPAFLERLVAVLTAMGYGGAAGAAEHLGKAGDEGLDGVIRQDRLGRDGDETGPYRPSAVQGHPARRPGTERADGPL